MKSVPFYGNTDDGLHCFQACFRMVLEYFLPDQNFSWEELDKMSAKLPGMATWPQRMLLNLHRMGFDVLMVESFDAEAFIAEGGEYLKRRSGERVAEWQISHSDLPQERQFYRDLLALDCIQRRIPTLEDAKTYLDKGYLIICVVNSCRLWGKEGYVGHAVLVYDIDQKYVTIHDPGGDEVEAKPGRRVTRAKFEPAWADPSDQNKDLIAITYRRGAI